MSEQWFVACAHQGQERRARRELENQGFGVYLPMCIMEMARKPKIKPFLPGYIFVSVNLDDGSKRWRALFSTYGVRTVICAGDKPQPVGEWIIKAIQEREVDGLVRLPPQANCKYSNGQRVYVRGSIVDVLFDEVVDHKRAAVFLSLLGRPHRVIVPISKIAAAPAGAVA